MKEYGNISIGTNIRVSDYEENQSFYEGIVINKTYALNGSPLLIVSCNYDSKSECQLGFCYKEKCCHACRVGREMLVQVNTSNDFEGRIKQVIESSRFIA